MSSENAMASFIFRILAPNKTGKAIKNENLAASFSLIPKNNAVDIVIPDLDIPGRMAIA